MKKLKGVLGVLIAVSTMMLFSSCCSLHCHNLVQNGSFEEPPTGPHPNGFYQNFSDPNWKNFPSGSQTFLVENNDGPKNTPNLGRLFNTPCGRQCIAIQGPVPDFYYTIGGVSQIITNLIANKTYCLSFLQSSGSYVTNSGAWSQLPGVIQVQLASSAGVNILPTSTFFVQTNTAWMKKYEKVKIPDGGSGSYTLTFSCVGTNAIYANGGDPVGQTVAYLDAVRLCKKPWWVLW